MKNISLYVDRKGTIFHTLKTKRDYVFWKAA